MISYHYFQYFTRFSEEEGDEEAVEDEQNIDVSVNNIVQSDDEDYILQSHQSSSISRDNDDKTYVIRKTTQLNVFNRPRERIIESEISAAEWKLELEHVSPQLVVRLNVDHKDWRTHVESMLEQEKVITELLPSTNEQLKHIADDISKIIDRIQKREAMLSSDTAISSLVSL